MFRLSYGDLSKNDIKITFLKKQSKIVYNKKPFEEFEKSQKEYRGMIRQLYTKEKENKELSFRDKELKFQDSLNYYLDTLQYHSKFLNDNQLISKPFLYYRISSLNFTNPGLFLECKNKNTLKKWNDLSSYQSFKDIKKNNKKYSYLYSTTYAPNIYKKLTGKYVCDKEEIEYKYALMNLYLYFEFLEEGGDAIFKVFSTCHSQTIEIIYLLSSLFQYVITTNGRTYSCFHFLPNYRISQKEIIQCIRKPFFKIEPKPDLKNYLKTIEKIATSASLYYSQSAYFKMVYCSYLNLDIIFAYSPIEFFKFKNITHYQILFLTDILKNQPIDYFYKTKQFTFFQNYMMTLSQLFKKKNFKNILELDIGWGIQSIFFLQQTSIQKYYLIDSFEQTFYQNQHYHFLQNHLNSTQKKILKFSSENYLFILSKLYESYQDTFFDFILLNNFTTEDDFLMKFFYCDKLIQHKGILMINNISNYRYINFIPLLLQQYKNYHIYQLHSNSILLQKI